MGRSSPTNGTKPAASSRRLDGTTCSGRSRTRPRARSSRRTSPIRPGACGTWSPLTGARGLGRGDRAGESHSRRGVARPRRPLPRALQSRLSRVASGDGRQRGTRLASRGRRAGVPRSLAAPAARPRRQMEPRARRSAPARRQQPEQAAFRREWGWRSPERWGRWVEQGARSRRRRRAGRDESGAGGRSAALDRPTGAQDPTRPDGADSTRRGAGRERLVILVLWVLAALQSGPAPDVTARVDRAHVTAGGQRLLTIPAPPRFAAPAALPPPP